MSQIKSTLRVLAFTANTQSGWTETSYVPPDKVPHHTDAGRVFTGTGASQSWTETALNYFDVVGTEDDSPPWRLLFQNRCLNSWNTSADFSHTFDVGAKVDQIDDCYTQDGSEGFTPNTGGGDQRSRSLTASIVNYLDWVVMPQISTSPGGGTSPGDPE